MKIKGSGFVIAGGGSGLGLTTALSLREAGARVGVLDLKQGEWDGAFAHADVADETGVDRALDALASEIGQLRGLINTTGIGHSGLSAGPDRKVTAEGFRRVLDVNTLGSFILAQAAAERMIASEADKQGERGVIINTSSIVAFEGQIGTAAYAAAKGGINAMTLPLAREFGPYGIRVVTIAPGIFETPMFSQARGPMVDWLREQVIYPDRPGDAVEFAEMVAHIVCNRMLNGTVIRLDGAYRVPSGRHDWWVD
ncbi:SDR family NAD(P)-dependent oxidoreductase [Pelagerythrobacter aerophilus]|uniref:SDR family NAD(P)-dependent oxidoreductase n=1 Tax=Pelagerythrobacter aerophilus TaxID=2306995 RepID=A0A418NCN9_9SPHN|nr:SDR family NAD(P)-dependent oxidoreductase [Pelagerythrobacter aerophilus]RIV75572.1 SDR family NAD(P)-dependent oxidoreductase [Pelagerythrobacter aerophilus]